MLPEAYPMKPPVSELGAKEQAILALRFRLPGRPRLLGEVAILDGKAKAARARTVEPQRARGRITTADGAGESRQPKRRRKYRDENDGANAHEESSTQNPTPERQTVAAVRRAVEGWGLRRRVPERAAAAR